VVIGPGISVEVQASEGLEIPVDAARLERAVRFVLGEEGVAQATISITFLADTEIAGMNREYLHHEGPTDVISFPLAIPGGFPVGDVYIGLEEASRQAAEHAVPLDEELLRLSIHGTLHVLGYDHPQGEGRLDSPMYLRQEALLSRLLGEGSGG
jgi:probable rRNA maturation factor